MFKIFTKINGNRKTFNSIEDLKKEIKRYGLQLHSLTLEVQDGETHYNFSLLSACNYISSGKIPEKHIKRRNEK